MKVNTHDHITALSYQTRQRREQWSPSRRNELSRANTQHSMHSRIQVYSIPSPSTMAPSRGQLLHKLTP